MTKQRFPLFSKRFLNLAAKPLFHSGLAFGGGVGMALAAAPLNVWGLAWIAMVPLWVAGMRSGIRDRGSGDRSGSDPRSLLPFSGGWAIMARPCPGLPDCIP